MTKQSQLAHPHMMTAKELCQLKGVSPAAITVWVRQGCPILREKPYIFDLDQVEAWLQARARKHHVGRVLAVLAEAAQ